MAKPGSLMKCQFLTWSLCKYNWY